MVYSCKQTHVLKVKRMKSKIHPTFSTHVTVLTKFKSKVVQSNRMLIRKEILSTNGRPIDL